MKHQIRLGVNIDHAATLRQVRGGTTSYPDMIAIAESARKGGADQITIHLREDRRHIQLHDVVALCKWRKIPINLEMAAEAPMLRIALKHKPEWVCLVPEKRQELTTEGGLDVVKNFKRIKPFIEPLQRAGTEISMFIEPSREQIIASFELGADAVEFHTGHWVQLKGPRKEKEWKRLVEGARLAHSLKLGVHAGHGLDYVDSKKMATLPFLEEVNIGHSLICHSLQMGLTEAVRKMRRTYK